jgi:hypothetical protein
MALLGETLLQRGIITKAQLDQALAEQGRSGKKIGEVIAELGFASSSQIDAAIKG